MIDVKELTDDELDQVSGGMMNKQVDGYPQYICSKCKHAFSLGDFGYDELGWNGSLKNFLEEHESKCNGR